MSKPLRAIPQARLKPKPAQPATTMVVACPAGMTGTGEHFSRSVSWNIASQVWDVGAWFSVSYDCIPPPDPTSTEQTLPCPAGQTGSGIYQIRTATWVCNEIGPYGPDGQMGNGFRSRQCTWVYGPWETVKVDCRPSQTITFYTANRTPSPNYTGGRPGAAGKAQYYSGSGSSNGYTMNLSLEVVSDGSMMWSNLSISVTGPNVAGAPITVNWDRAYSYFAPTTLDSSGNASWHVPNSQWTGHATMFAVTITV